MTVDWDSHRRTVVSASYLDAGHLDHGYAITGHRAQGLTVNAQRTATDLSATLDVAE